jgi:hypothetical protein
MGRGNEAVAALRTLEEKIKTRMRDFMMAARTMIEGDAAGSIAAVGRILNSAFSDPEGLLYLTRHLAHLNQVDAALELFERVVGGVALFLINRRITETDLLQSLNLRLKEPPNIRAGSGERGRVPTAHLSFQVK